MRERRETTGDDHAHGSDCDAIASAEVVGPPLPRGELY
jgi:hypothetical protein